MPVRNANFRRRGNDEYSFTTRPGSSRDFARHRRYGDDEDDDHVMSQVSSPLHLSKLGKSNRRNYSPLETYSPPVLGRRERDESPYLQRKEKLSGPVRHALALCGELDEEDPYYLARRSMTSTRDVGEDYFDGHDDEVVMTPRDRKATSQRRYYEEDEEPIVMQQSHRYVTSQSRRWDDEDESVVPTRINTSRMRRDVDEEDAYPEIRQRSRASTDLMFENDKLPGRVQRSRKRDYSDDTNKSYTMPVSRRRPDDALAEEEPAIREVASYIATRKKFAIEDDDDLRQLKNKKYQYRTRGPTRQSVEINRDPIDRSRDRFARAPMFDMKLRSHVIWEKMYVKFTCTIKGTPEPKITWYHNMVAIEPMLKEPGVVRISNQFGVHTLEIFKACLEDSGTYRVSAQNHKGEISSYATLLVRRYDDGKVGYYDIKSGYNMKKPTDYPDVENLNVAESEDTVKNEIDSTETEPTEPKGQPEQSVATKVTYSGKSVAVGDGKFESTLKFRIPGKSQPLKTCTLSVQEDKVQAVRKSRRTSEDESDETKTVKPITKSVTCEEFGECLMGNLDVTPANASSDFSPKGALISEDIIEMKSARQHSADSAKVDEG